MVARHRMGNGYQREAAQAEDLGLRPAQRAELVAADDDGGDAVPLQFDGVVDTPRRARPSIGDRQHDGVTALQAAHHFSGRRGGGRLDFADLFERSGPLLQLVSDVTQQESGVRLLVVQQPDAPPPQVIKTRREGSLHDIGRGHGHENLDLHHPSLRTRPTTSSPRPMHHAAHGATTTRPPAQPPFSGATSTRVSENVGALPRSAKSVRVMALDVAAPGFSFTQCPSEQTTTPLAT